MIYEDNVWPICEVVYVNKVGLATISTKVYKDLLKRMRCFTFTDNGLLGVRWKMILTMFAREHHVLYIIVYARPCTVKRVCCFV